MINVSKILIMSFFHYLQILLKLAEVASLKIWAHSQIAILDESRLNHWIRRDKVCLDSYSPSTPANFIQSLTYEWGNEWVFNFKFELQLYHYKDGSTRKFLNFPTYFQSQLYYLSSKRDEMLHLVIANAFFVSCYQLFLECSSEAQPVIYLSNKMTLL